MNRRKFLATLGGIGAAGVTGAAAFSSATVERNVEISVVADDAADAALQLDPGPSGGSTIRSDGQLLITGSGAGDGLLTPRGTFVFGDPNNPVDRHAFALSNQEADSNEFSITATTSDNDTFLELEFYDDTGSKVGDSFTGFTVTADGTPELGTKAKVPDGTSITVTVREDVDQNGTIDNTASRNIPDGTYSSELTELTFDGKVDISIEVKFSKSDPNAPDPVLYEAVVSDDSGTQADDTGQLFTLSGGQTVYAVMTVEPSPDTSDVTGSVVFESTEV